MTFLQQSKDPLFGDDGGHSTWFEINDTLYITFHSPNSETEHAIIDILSWNENKEKWFLVNYTMDNWIPGYNMIITISIFSLSLISNSLKKRIKMR